MSESTTPETQYYSTKVGHGRTKESLFDVRVRAYDGADIAELVGLIALKSIEEQLPHLNFGL